MPLNDYLRSKTQVIVIGEAGSGKSSLLRFLALDILAEDPVLESVRERFANATPVGLPFALWVRLSIDRGTPVSMEDAVAEFFRSQGETDLSEDIGRVINSQNILLLVDGLDESPDATATRTLIAVLTAMSGRNGISIIATSRPHGARNLREFAGSWERCNLAAFSDAQRRALAHLWFGVLERFEAGSSGAEAHIKARAEKKADAFITALQVNSGIGSLSQTPLFLLAFLSLHRHGHTLPRNRFAASREIVDQLMEHQPGRRDINALSTRVSVGDSRLRNRVIADFAFALQAGELRGAMPDAATEEEALVRATALI
jgi:hypothetical protein